MDDWVWSFMNLEFSRCLEERRFPILFLLSSPAVPPTQWRGLKTHFWMRNKQIGPQWDGEGREWAGVLVGPVVLLISFGILDMWKLWFRRKVCKTGRQKTQVLVLNLPRVCQQSESGAIQVSVGIWQAMFFSWKDHSAGVWSITVFFNWRSFLQLKQNPKHYFKS